jgi:3-hydroxyisobutyrate dehydrogenase-like beta-hydroxyacid dehydrogenase
MDAPMARNLPRAGHDLTVWNRTEEKARPLEVEAVASAAGVGART